MKPTIEYKLDFDFISYTYICANLEEERKGCESNLKQPGKSHKDIKKKQDAFFDDAEAYYHETMSFIQRNELNMFFKRIYIYNDYLMFLALSEDTLESQSLGDFKNFVLDKLEISQEDLEFKKVHAALKDHYESPSAYTDFKKETELILETLKDERMFNVNFKNAVTSLKELFIQERYQPRKSEFDEILKEHNELYQKDSTRFMLNISSGMMKETDIKRPDMQAYITFFSRYKFMLNVEKNKNYVVYNYKLKDVNPEEMEKKLIQSALKFLSDPKRYQMIQMLTKEKWYANELAKEFKITPATMSYHVNKLFSLGLITFEQREHNKLYIELDHDRLRYLLNLIIKDLMGEL